MVCVVYMCCCLRDVKIQDGQKSLNFDPCPFFGGVIQSVERIPLWQRMFTLLVQTTWNWMGLGVCLICFIYSGSTLVGSGWKEAWNYAKLKLATWLRVFRRGLIKRTSKAQRAGVAKLFWYVKTGVNQPIQTNSYFISLQNLGISWNQNVSPPSDYKIDIQELWWRSSPNFWAKMGSWLPPNPQIH